MSGEAAHYCFDGHGNMHIGLERGRSWRVYDQRFRSSFKALDGRVLTVETRKVHLMKSPRGSLVIGSKNGIG